jgi:thiamine pyrophosphokinase
MQGGAEDAHGPAAVLFLDGSYEDAAFYRALGEAAGMLVGADGGARRVLELGLTPDLVVGDFDSLDADSLRILEAAGVELVRHPRRKDQTDGELAVDEALRRGATQVVLVGALGALDHTLGHLAILRRLAARGVVARLASPGLAVSALIAPGEARLSAPPGTRVSVVPLDGDAVVTLEGLDYLLDLGELRRDTCLGLGNAVAAGAQARVQVHDGSAVILVEDGAETFAAPPPQAGTVA